LIVNRTPTPAWRSAALAPKVARVGRSSEMSGMDLVVQATSAAMTGRSGTDVATGRPDKTGALGAEAAAVVVAGVDPSRFGAGQLVVDIVYDPPLTPFLREAREHGATVRNGLGMLVHQAAHQIRLWTGIEPPLGVMWAVVGGDGTQASPSSEGSSTD
jgi:shikimate dehydrogenase